jgi:hypothetical protein
MIALPAHGTLQYKIRKFSIFFISHKISANLKTITKQAVVALKITFFPAKITNTNKTP